MLINNKAKLYSTIGGKWNLNKAGIPQPCNVNIQAKKVYLSEKITKKNYRPRRKEN